MTKIMVNLFDLRSIPKVGVFVCHGNRSCGKSTLAREITRTLCQRDQPQRVILVGDDAISHAGDLSISPRTSINLVPPGWAAKEMQAILDRHSQALQERRVILLDIDNVLDGRTLWDELFVKAASLNIALVVTAQMQQQVCNTSRWKHVDLFFGFTDNCTYAVQRLWETFFSQWTQKRSDFQQIFDQCTNAYECVVFDDRAPRTPYYYYKTPEKSKAAPVTEPEDLKPGCRVIYRTTRDVPESQTFLTTLLTTLRATQVLVYTPYSETYQFVANSPGVRSVHRVTSYNRLLEITQEALDADDKVPTLVLCETQQLHKPSKLLDLARNHVSVVFFTDLVPPKIDGVSYFFKNKLWSVYNDDLPCNVHGFPIVDVTADSASDNASASATDKDQREPSGSDVGCVNERGRHVPQTGSDSAPNTQQLFQALQTPGVESVHVHPQKFDITSKHLPRTGVFACVGPAHCGKSTLATQLVQVLHQTHDTQFIVLAGDDALRMKLPDDKTTLRLNVRTASSALLRLMQHQSAAKSPDNIIVVLDQLVWWDPKTLALFKDLLSRLPQLNMALVVVTQHMQDLALLKGHVDFLFAFPTPNKCHVEKLWDVFFTGCSNSDTFKGIMDARNVDTRWTSAVHAKADPTELYQCFIHATL
jgi:ABC-type cobalamin/Fe3+-siderophores transport system ATPase subunit